MQTQENGLPSSQTTYENLLNHVVLPRALPEGYLKDHEQQELSLLSIMVQTVEKDCEWIPSATVRLCQCLKRAHMSRTPETVSNEISKLQPGETFAMFVRRQNTGLIIHMPNEQVPNAEKTVTVVTFPGNLHPKEIYNHTSDLELKYPSQSLKVKFSKMLRSEEFAFQLCYLYGMLPSDQKHNRNYVNTWLTTVLSDTDTTLTEFPIITKKIRDEVIGERKKQQSAMISNYYMYASDYFRRSNFYMSIKVFLQLSLTLELGEEIGRHVYKIIMLQFMTRLWETFGESQMYTDLDVDLTTQFLAKIARRIEKLIDLKPETNDEIEKFSNNSIEKAKRVISTLRVRLDKKIQDLHTLFEDKARLEPLIKLDFVGDVHQKVPKLCNYLETLKNAGNQNLSNSTLQIKKYDRLEKSQNGKPSISFQYNDKIELHLILTDFENWVLYELEFETEPELCNYYLQIYKAYSSAADSFHANDPFGISKMMLVRLKLVALMDLIAVNVQPSFKSHRSCIDPNVFNILLLPQSADMKLAITLRKYFAQRNQTAKYPGLLEEQHVSSHSFSVQFAMKNDEMKNVRQAILDMGEQKISEKTMEWTNGRERVQKLRNEMNGLSCEYYDHVSFVGHKLCTEKRHSDSCRRCSLNERIKQVRISQYERPLPEDLKEQYAIAFELRIPNEISTLRDMLHLTMKFTQSSQNGKNAKRWTSNHQVSQLNTSSGPIVHLGSSKSIKLSTFHVDNPIENFIALNGENCFYYASDSLHPSINIVALKKMCTLSVEPGSPYADLQWTLNTTTHTQNQVLARQSECPQNLTIAEFIEFGSLRADGHRLQLRKLYASIRTEALSFEQSSVLSLILQSMWETGIVGENGFESHVDFKDPQFALAMIDALDNFIENQRNNWVHPKKLLLTAFITVRIFEINGNEKVADKLKDLLHKLRDVLIEWMEKIQNALNEMTNRTQSAEQSLRLSLAIVSISCALTFFVNPKHEYFNKIFELNPHNGFTAPRIWLLSIITLKNNIVLNEYIHTQSQSYLRMFIRLVRYSAIHIESKIREMIENDPTAIREYIKHQWPLAAKGVFERNYFASSGPQVWVTEIELKQVTTYVTIDIITGSFLVNNLPIARLPDRLTANKLYERVFENYSFEVQTDGGNSFSTVHKYNGCSYEFGWSNNALKVVEHGEYNCEMELIPPEIFHGDIPELLVENYSHWWFQRDNIIMFRPIKFKDKHFSNDSGIEYKLDLNESRLKQMRTNRHMLDINSGSYQRILNHLSRLEQQKYIHVLMNSRTVASVELVRMNLKFKIDDSDSNNNGSYNVLSNEFSRMKISLQQNFGTLYGLDHGLLLECVSNEKSQSSSKLLLLPHSEITSSCINSHVSVDINLKCELRHPPFHRYEVDEFLRQLKPSNSSYSAWFYLAYLHAITSHGEIEPLTGMSGTERALQILQSSFAWSSAPYDGEAIKTLQLLANLTPTRGLEENVQKITWPSKVPKHCAQDSFWFIVKKLIEDSQRLMKLHSNEKMNELKELKGSNLNIRDYFRCLQLKPNHQVADIFVMNKKLLTKSMENPSITYSQNTRVVTALYHQEKCLIPKDLNLGSFLKSTTMLDGYIHIQSIPSIFTHNDVAGGFRNLWLSLYQTCRKQQLNREQFNLLFSLYAHKSENLHAILALQAVASNPNVFADINPPNVDQFLVEEGLYSSATITTFLGNPSLPYDYYSSTWSDNRRLTHNQSVENEKERLTAFVTSKWPCDQVSLHSQHYTHFSSSKISDANLLINKRLLIWNNNRKLNDFIAEVESKLRQLISTNSMIFEKLNGNCSDVSINKTKFNINFEAKVCENLNEFPEVLGEANEVWINANKEQNLMRTVKEWWEAFYGIVHSKKNMHLIESGLFPRMVPTLVLPRIASEHTNQELMAVIGALALTIANEQRTHRIETYMCQPQLKPALDRELQNVPHINWSPSEYPEWLLFEIEQNLTIRRIQIEIAERMINPPDIGTKHSVMQLNMGEGKTAVIVPILASVLANGEQACQITVLKSLFATNLNSLRQYLGGMLNRRIYTFPCRRDMPIAEYVPQMMTVYEECKQERGVILTLPEYRLSFQLKIYESVKKGDIDNARHFLSVHKWINANVRNILDESDAILHAKYQLIYTVGNQLPLDGGSYRWSIAQSILKRVPHHMKKLHVELGKEKIEFDQHYVKNGHVYGAPIVDYREDVFTPCRILDESVYERIKNLLIEDFLQGNMSIVFPEMTNATKNDLRRLLSSRQISNDVFDRVMNDFPPTQREIFLILSGLLRFDVLKLVMMRRWRVNYGVNEKGTRKMAIPFKAKDVAAEMTEFGHPDVAICLTQLSYYYSGLTDQQLHRVFDVLKTNQSAPEIYEKWIDNIPANLIEPSIQNYSGVNLNDPNQRNDLLFPLLRFNMHVIDYWLSIDVYPREAKTFEKKLMCTAWDLCSEHMQHRVTGFSGTNDTKNILPLPIAQNDLEELEQTNENVRQTLLQPENQAYRRLEANISGQMILEYLVASQIPVLLDAGALMLELSNKEMAKEWLKIAPSSAFDAAIYFDSKDVLQTIDRNGIIAAFDCSVYRDNLCRCLVYLDDVHTRGTDLKFPLGWKACVTLSGDIARDKTVQACMRMRQLGKGHSIAFWASHEANIRIRKTCNLTTNDSVTNEHVIKFICTNSERFETDNTVHWAAAAHNYAKKLAGHKLYEGSTDDDNSMKGLYNKCVDDEFTKLENMYGDLDEAFITEIADAKFNKLVDVHKTNPNISDFIKHIKDSVGNKLRKQAPEVRRYKHALDEEQEKELEHELEEQREVQRPPSMNPETPVFDEMLRILFSDDSSEQLIGQLKSTSNGGLLTFSSSLSNTELYRSQTKQENPWSENLFVTRDFVRVLKTTSQSCDDFLRPVWWIGGIHMNGKSIWILLSLFECDRLIPTFRSSTKSTLLMYRPRTSKFHDNLLDELRLSITAQNTPLKMDLKSEVEIGIYAGSMYFKTEAEQNTFCGFLGLIPRPRASGLKLAFEQGIIKPNGFVSKEHRNHSDCVSRCVGDCRFLNNPVDLIIKLIVARHQFMRTESHVASIVERGKKLEIEEAQKELDGQFANMNIG